MIADVDALTRACALVVAICGAATSVGGIFFGLNIWWKNRGKDGLRHWVHETSGAATVARAVDSLREDLHQTGEEIKVLQTQHAAAVTLSNTQHSENQATQHRQDSDMGALVGAQDRTGVALKALAEEIALESSARSQALTALSAQLQDVAHLAAIGAQHARSRKRHPPHVA